MTVTHDRSRMIKKLEETHPSADKLDHGKWTRFKFTVADRSRQRANVLVVVVTGS